MYMAGIDSSTFHSVCGSVAPPGSALSNAFLNILAEDKSGGTREDRFRRTVNVFRGTEGTLINTVDPVPDVVSLMLLHLDRQSTARHAQPGYREQKQRTQSIMNDCPFCVFQDKRKEWRLAFTRHLRKCRQLASLDEDEALRQLEHEGVATT